MIFFRKKSVKLEKETALSTLDNQWYSTSSERNVEGILKLQCFHRQRASQGPIKSRLYWYPVFSESRIAQWNYSLITGSGWSSLHSVISSNHYPFRWKFYLFRVAQCYLWTAIDLPWTWSILPSVLLDLLHATLFPVLYLTCPTILTKCLVFWGLCFFFPKMYSQEGTLHVICTWV